MSKKVNDRVLDLVNEVLRKKEVALNFTASKYIAGEYFRPSIIFSKGEFKVSTASKFQLLEGMKALFLHKECANKLNMEINYLGFSVEDWTTDFLTRSAIIDNQTQLKKLTSVEEDVRKLLTATQIRKLSLDTLFKEVSQL